ncbi:MAG TPA: PEP-utilizing enzyme [Candidatus Nanoarchaeia archaeon]|nr:PEP-utilizing enzyme [Candidatus Nanoarchaeia archaeon]
MKKINLQDYQDSFKWQFGAYPFYTSVYLKSASGKLKNKYYNDYRVSLSYFINGNLIILQPKKELLRVGNMIIKEALSGGDQYLKELLSVHKEMKAAVSLCQQARRKGDFKSYKKWWPATEKALSHVTGMFFCFDFTSEKFLNGLKVGNPQDFEILNRNIASKKLSFMDEAGKYLLKLNKKYPRDFHQVYALFLEKFGWFQNNYEGVFEIGETWLKKYLSGIKKRKFINLTHRSAKKIPEKFKTIIKVINESIIFKDDKKKLLLLAVDLMEPWLKDVCRNNSWKYNELRWLGFDEVLALIKNKKSPYLALAKKCERNKKRIGMMTRAGYDDSMGKVFLSKILRQEEATQKVKEIKGSTASDGFIRGRVKVILDARKDSVKFKKGEILVTSMTRPEYLPLMARASAFITDEGGIACHAAIIAREMKKPCIIGTKIATKVLKDGDQVEVNANHGWVRIIKRV